MIFDFCFQSYGLQDCIYLMTIIYNGYGVKAMKYKPIYASFLAVNSALIGKWNLIFEYGELEGQLLKISLSVINCDMFVVHKIPVIGLVSLKGRNVALARWKML